MGSIQVAKAQESTQRREGQRLHTLFPRSLPPHNLPPPLLYADDAPVPPSSSSSARRPSLPGHPVSSSVASSDDLFDDFTSPTTSSHGTLYGPRHFDR
jgi:hypothetical protein